MFFLFSIARILQLALKIIQAAIGIAVVAHGARQWAGAKRAVPI